MERRGGDGGGQLRRNRKRRPEAVLMTGSGKSSASTGTRVVTGCCPTRPCSSTRLGLGLLQLPQLAGPHTQVGALGRPAESAPYPALPSPAPHRTTTYSAGEGKDWKSGDLQFLQKRNSLAKSLPVLLFCDPHRLSF